jgi:hypothetical protein
LRVELPRKESRRRLEDLIRPAQLAVLPLEFLDALGSEVVTPGRLPSSTSACLPQPRSVSAVIPNLPAIDVIAAHCDSYS